MTVKQNDEESRFELKAGDGLAVAQYRRDGDAIIFTHTEVPEGVEGEGYGSKLAKGALDAAREQGLEVIPQCAFIASYIKRHREYLDLVPEERRELVS